MKFRSNNSKWKLICRITRNEPNTFLARAAIVCSRQILELSSSSAHFLHSVVAAVVMDDQSATVQGEDGTVEQEVSHSAPANINQEESEWDLDQGFEGLYSIFGEFAEFGTPEV